MYNNIIIYETDFNDKYLLKFNDNSLYVGSIVKEIILLLKNDIKENSIPKIINEKYNITINDSDIREVINKIEKTLFVKKKTSLIKLIKIINPNKINFSFLTQKNKEKTFYKYLIITFLINIYAFIKVEQVISKSIIETIFFYLFLILILISHELGHFIASKKYGIETNEIGFGFYSIFPVFYIDLGEVWRLSIKKRIVINLSGIFSQLFFDLLKKDPMQWSSWLDIHLWFKRDFTTPFKNISLDKKRIKLNSERYTFFKMGKHFFIFDLYDYKSYPITEKLYLQIKQNRFSEIQSNLYTELKTKNIIL